MGILENPWFFQLSVLLSTDLKKTKALIAREAGLGPDSKVLDVCCGTGNFADLAKGEYVGVDLNEKYLNFAKKRFANDGTKSFFVKDINKISLEDKSFDSVFMISAIHHFSDAEVGKLLSKVCRIVRGSIIITDPALETGNPISRFLISLDRGGYMRSGNEQMELISRYLDIKKSFAFYSRFASIRMIVCGPKVL